MQLNSGRESKRSAGICTRRKVVDVAEWNGAESGNFILRAGNLLTTTTIARRGQNGYDENTGLYGRSFALSELCTLLWGSKVGA
jgi:hypothetical protein